MQVRFTYVRKFKMETLSSSNHSLACYMHVRACYLHVQRLIY